MKLKYLFIAIAACVLTTGCEPTTTDTSTTPTTESTNGATVTPQTNTPAAP